LSQWDAVRFPRIKLDELELIPAGRSGVDFKMIIKTQKACSHHTVSVGYPHPSNPWELPLYAEETLETRPKAHHVIGRGVVNMRSVVDSILPAGLPVIQKLTTKNQPDPSSEFVAFGPQFAQVFTSGRITLTEETFSFFQPVTYSELDHEDFLLAAPVGVTGSGIIIGNRTDRYSLTFPSFDTIDERLERIAVMRKVDEYIEGLDDDYSEM
jgi:hypothetical protein